VLDQSVAEAEAMHLEGGPARQFFDVQIRIASAVEERAIANWAAQGSQPPPARDLTSELRPALDEISRDLLAAAYLASPALTDAGETQLLRRLSPLRRHLGVDDALLAELSHALAGLRLAGTPDRQSIQRAGVLRIATTGDYAPFSSDRGGELHGFDVQLGEALAGQWGVKAVFVRATWGSLMTDLKQGRFDLAMSGITVIPDRSKMADFATSYYSDGKTAIARRVDADKYRTLAQIDQRGVRVIVNPGGTNERFVREHITQATILIHSDNRTIFNEILGGRADVMFTDGIEVRLQERKHPELIGTCGPLTHAQKAIMLPEGSELTPAVNEWLAPQLADGRINAQLEKALREAQ